jgi:hypothetical protein
MYLIVLYLVIVKNVAVCLFILKHNVYLHHLNDHVLKEKRSRLNQRFRLLYTPRILLNISAICSYIL